MKQIIRLLTIIGLAAAIATCGEKKDPVDVQKVMQEGMKKEQKMMEGMQKNTEDMMKKTEEQKEKK